MVHNTAQNSSDNLHSYHYNSDIFYWIEWRGGSDRVILYDNFTSIRMRLMC